MSALHALAVGLGAFLLFWIELLVARLVLPLLGGAPLAWNTCLFFFQAVLLAGYAIVHVAGRWLGTRRHTLLHAALLALPLLVLPVALPSGAGDPPGRPLFWLLGLLAAMAGLPCLLVATTAPLLQRWHSLRRDEDPYWLYAASNLGSFLALGAYPLLIEPRCSLVLQGRLWAAGYGVLVTLTLACAVGLRPRSLDVAPAAPRSSPWLWFWLSFLPASLLHGTTTVVTTDTASVPLLWCVPLALYLGSFVLAFARRPLAPVALIEVLLPPWIAAMIATQLLGLLHPIALLAGVHLTGFALLACLTHLRLAQTRPPAAELTRFYLWIAIGGLAGGAFNALAAPRLFPTVLEYPTMLVLAGLVVAATTARARALWLLSCGMTGSLLLARLQPRLLPASAPGFLALLALLLPLGRSLGLRRPPLFAAGLLLLLAGGFGAGPLSGRLRSERSFFGVHRVLRDVRRGLVVLMHGGTVHGRQSTDPALRREPLCYYHRGGPAGQALQHWTRTDVLLRVAVLGLGAGTLAAYARPGQRWDFYEIDPAVIRLAREPFTYLRDARAPCRIVAGDARRKLRDAPPGAYDLIVLDAFSSDAIPVHLATREAFRLYLSRLTPVGLLLVNISNRYLALEPLVAALADDLGLHAVAWRQADLPEAERRAGKSPSHWVVLARDASDVGPLPGPWRALERRGMRVWTDNHSSIIGSLRFWR